MKLITNPNEFFQELSREDVRIQKPMTIVVAIAAIISAYQYLLAAKLSQVIPSDLAGFFVVGAYIGIIGSFIGIFAVWLILTVMMHGLSSLLFNGKGSFRRTFEFTGYGFLPSLVGSLVTIPMSAYYVLNAKVPKISIEQLQQNPEIVKSVLLSILPRDLVYSNLIINLAITVWSLTLWTFAINMHAT